MHAVQVYQLRTLCLDLDFEITGRYHLLGSATGISHSKSRLPKPFMMWEVILMDVMAKLTRYLDSIHA